MDYTDYMMTGAVVALVQAETHFQQEVSYLRGDLLDTVLQSMGLQQRLRSSEAELERVRDEMARWKAKAIELMPVKPPPTPRTLQKKVWARALDPHLTNLANQAWLTRPSIVPNLRQAPDATPNSAISAHSPFRTLVTSENCLCVGCGRSMGMFLGLCITCMQRQLPPIHESLLVPIGLRALEILRTEWEVAPRMMRSGNEQSEGSGVYVIWLCSRLTNTFGGLPVPPFIFIQVARNLLASHLIPTIIKSPSPVLSEAQLSRINANTHVFSLDVRAGHYVVAENPAFGGIVRQAVGHTMTYDPEREACLVCLQINILICIQTIGLGPCDHIFAYIV